MEKIIEYSLFNVLVHLYLIKKILDLIMCFQITKYIMYCVTNSSLLSQIDYLDVD